MSTPPAVFSLRNRDECWWEVLLSDGVHEATIWASSERSPSLLVLLKAVQLLLQGASSAKCSWEAAYGEYRWRFSRQEKQILIHILWVDEMGMKRKTLLHMKCDLLAFARELLSQASQFPDLENEERPAVLPEDAQHFQGAIRAFEQAGREDDTT